MLVNLNKSHLEQGLDDRCLHIILEPLFTLDHAVNVANDSTNRTL